MFSIIKNLNNSLEILTNNISNYKEFYDFVTNENSKYVMFHNIKISNTENILSLLSDISYSENYYQVEIDVEGEGEENGGREIHLYQVVKRGGIIYYYNDVILKNKMYLVKNPDCNPKSEIKKVSSNPNMILEISNAMNDTEYKINDHLPIPDARVEVDGKENWKYMWMIFDNKGTYLGICKTLNYAQDIVKELAPPDTIYPELLPTEDIIVSLALKQNGNMLYHAVQVKITKTVKIKSQILHWKNIIEKYIHTYIFKVDI